MQPAGAVQVGRLRAPMRARHKRQDWVPRGFRQYPQRWPLALSRCRAP